MALSKSVEMPTGETGDYHKIVAAFINWEHGYGEIKVSLFKSLAMRNANKSPMQTDTFVFSGAEFPFSIGEMDKRNCIAIGYEALKLRPEFVGSQDV